jgi:hypothetical protein
MELPFKVGDRLADIRLGSMGGRSVTLGEYAGRKKLVYVWASWCGCREYLGALQEFHLAHPSLPVITIACDAQGVDLPMKYRPLPRGYEMDRRQLPPGPPVEAKRWACSCSSTRTTS